MALVLLVQNWPFVPAASTRPTGLLEACKPGQNIGRVLSGEGLEGLVTWRFAGWLVAAAGAKVAGANGASGRLHQEQLVVASPKLHWCSFSPMLQAQLARLTHLLLKQSNCFPLINLAHL